MQKPQTFTSVSFGRVSMKFSTFEVQWKLVLDIVEEME
jgi:hypothetical protein